ncbi:AraC family transcriptional regulator [Neorhizobium sp. R1-B]|uniref:AraC family transcriptional regulator n=1 Tax=unclassified Neorhizobium TaxID=2629175 RepID=UPI0010473626|nr:MULTISPECIES: AraC family transcriptional regulator [unclassified Neorhizobium]TCV71013.1 AraC family transcriptional regulator [Neorhizobium sp. S3-V5DH]TDX83344.1 AraC family transcriptional regulator [Neorhizobium sp. R1-B]
MREALSENPDHTLGVARDDVLSALLSTIRLSGSLQFCFMPSGNWQTDATPSMAGLSGRPSGTIPFHIVVAGNCWLKMEAEEALLETGDVVVFPFGTGHQLGAGADGSLINPTRELPPKPWRQIPVIRHGGDGQGVRLLCGYLQCDALGFAPLKRALPKLIHVRTRGANDGDWLRATIRQMVDEVDSPRAGGISMLPRLTEIIFIEILRHRIMMAEPRATGWLAALADPALCRCLSLIHDDPKRDWSLEDLSAASGMSRSVLAERFQTVLGTSPIRYVRDWRLYLASVKLSTTGQAIAVIAYEAGYATEAAFNRAFSRAFGSPPATWRAVARAWAGSPGEGAAS